MLLMLNKNSIECTASSILVFVFKSFTHYMKMSSVWERGKNVKEEGNELHAQFFNVLRFTLRENVKTYFYGSYCIDAMFVHPAGVMIFGCTPMDSSREINLFLALYIKCVRTCCHHKKNLKSLK